MDNSSINKWIEDFEKDQNPEKEIRIWEAIAAAYQSYCSTRTLTLAGKRDVLGVLVLRSGMDDEDGVLGHVKLGVLTASQARDVMRLYNGARNLLKSRGDK